MRVAQRSGLVQALTAFTTAGGEHFRGRRRGAPVGIAVSDACDTAKMGVDPRGKDLKRYLSEDSGGPVVMLNLLRYAEGGRELYARYVEALRETFLPRYGAEVLYAGEGSTALVAESGQQWDAVLVVQYPSRQAFSDMVADPDYQQVTQWRTAALTEAVLQDTVPWPTEHSAT